MATTEPLTPAPAAQRLTRMWKRATAVVTDDQGGIAVPLGLPFSQVLMVGLVPLGSGHVVLTDPTSTTHARGIALGNDGAPLAEGGRVDLEMTAMGYVAAAKCCPDCTCTDGRSHHGDH